MPTERFYRLPEVKRQAIREAALKEFARVPFEKVSINQIIRNADISRGSFYTYFVDKQDVVKFLLEDTFEQMEDICKKEMDRNGGDYFALVEVMFEYFVGVLRSNPDMVTVARNIFSNKENNELVGLTDGPPQTAYRCREARPDGCMKNWIGAVSGLRPRRNFFLWPYWQCHLWQFL